MALPFFGIGMKTDFSNPVATDEFSKFSGILSVALSKHHLSGFETVHWDSITSTSFVHSDASFNFMAAVTICSDFGAPK